MAEQTSGSDFSSKKRIISTLVKKGKGLRKKGKNGINADDLDFLLPIIQKLIKHIELNGAKKEGILRVSGSITDIHQLRSLLLKDANTVDLTKYDVHTVCGAFKMLIRDLSEPLCTFAKYEDFVKAVAIEDESTRISILRAIVASIPIANQQILYNIMGISSKIVDNADVTKMDAHNVAVVLAPTILRPKVETTQTMLMDANSIISITRDILKNYTMIFDTSQYDKKTNVNNNNYKKMSLKGTIVLSDAQQELYEKQITDLRERLDQQNSLYDQLSKECFEFQEAVEQLEKQLEVQTTKSAELHMQVSDLTKQKEDLMATLTQGATNTKWEAKYKESQNQLRQEQLAAELSRQQMKQVQQLGEKKDRELLELRNEARELRAQQQQFDKNSQEVILLRDQMNTLRMSLSETQQSLKEKEQEVVRLQKSQPTDNVASKTTGPPSVKGRVSAFGSADSKSPEVEKVRAELEAEHKKREKELQDKVTSLQKQLQDLSSPAKLNNNTGAKGTQAPTKPLPANPALKTSAVALQAKAIASSGSPVSAATTAQQKEVKELKEQLLSWMIVSLKLELLFRGEMVQALDHEELLLEITQQGITFELWPALIMSKLIPPPEEDERRSTRQSASAPPSRFNSLRGTNKIQ